MVYSLWFRLIGAFTAVLLVVLVSVSSFSNSVTQREFTQYVESRNAYLRSLIPTLVPVETVITIPPLAVQQDREIEPPPEEVVDVIVEEIVDQVIIEEVIVRPRVTWPIFSPSIIQQSDSSRFLTDVRQRTQTAVFIAGIVALVLGTLIIRQITRPLAQLRLAAQAITQGKSGVRVAIRSKDEIGKVATAFNQMAATIETQEAIRKQMVADVAHELRTPLTIMQSNLEAMLDGLLQPTPTELQELHDEVGRLTRMTDDLRLLSLADAGQLRLDLCKVDLCQLVDAAMTSLSPLAASRSVQLNAETAAAPLIISADGDRLQQAVRNLVDNAIRHAPISTGVVCIKTRQDNLSVHISITDNGVGIQDNELPYLFERFWRGDKSRTRHSGGSGLGLSIVKQVVDLHQGQIQVASSPGSGTVFTVSLPVAQ